jgi:hypothetical protein
MFVVTDRSAFPGMDLRTVDNEITKHWHEICHPGENNIATIGKRLMELGVSMERGQTETLSRSSQ